MLRKWKKYGCILFLLIALPYVITIFINGPSGLTAPTTAVVPAPDCQLLRRVDHRQDLREENRLHLRR